MKFFTFQTFLSIFHLEILSYSAVKRSRKSKKQLYNQQKH